MTTEEKAAAFDRLCEMLLVPPGFPAVAAYAEVEKLVDERSEARHARAELELELVSVEKEVQRCHFMLGYIYEDLRFLEGSLSMEQILLCPIDLCKYRKYADWEEEGRFEHYLSPEGKAEAKAQRHARGEQLLEWTKAQGKDARMLVFALQDNQAEYEAQGDDQ